MARKREQMWMPGVSLSPFPDGFVPERALRPRKRKPRQRRSVAGPVEVKWHDDRHAEPAEIRIEALEIRTTAGVLMRADRATMRSQVGTPEPGRPVTYEHPLARAARQGRLHALWRGPEPVLEDPAERRAFEVARARRAAAVGRASGEAGAGNRSRRLRDFR